MDLHIIPGITAKDVAEAHCEDIKIQDQYNCKCMTYWIDEKRDSVFCLIDAPNKDAIRNLHDSSHGLIPHEIIPVNETLVEAFLGRLQDPETFDDLSSSKTKIFNDPAFRIILVCKIMDTSLLNLKLGTDQTQRVLELFKKIYHKELKDNNGRLVSEQKDQYILSFKSVTDSIQYATSVQNALHVAAELIDFRIGLHAGMPVTTNNSLFGETINYASFFCEIAETNTIIISSTVRSILDDSDDQVISDNQRIIWLSASDNQFNESFIKTLQNNYGNSKFGIKDFCSNMSVSKSKLFRKCKAMTGLSVNNLLREYRLSKALKLLKNPDRNISQIAYDIGFSSPSYFTKCFQKRFGTSPTTIAAL